jgi:hypothetical protein
MTRAEGCSSSAAEDMLPSEDIVKGGFQWRTHLAVLNECDSSRGEVNLHDSSKIRVFKTLLCWKGFQI